jgi:spermidine synthase
MPASSPRLLPAFAAAGFAATAAQVLLLRELLVSAAGDEASIGTGLAAWLLGITLGAVAWRRAAPRRALSAAALLALLAIAGSAGIVALRVLRFLAAPPAGELPGLGLVLLLAVASLLPAGALVGASFAALATAGAGHLPAESALARLYVAESLGSLVAGAGASLLVGTLLAPLPAALAAGFAATLLLLLSSLPGRRAGLAAAALLAVAAAAARPLDEATERLRFSALAPGAPLAAFVDTPHSHLAVSGGTPRHLYESGAFAASFPDPFSSETLAHLAGSLALSPRRVLALGAIERGPLRFLLLHGPERIDLVAPDARALAFVRDRLPPEDVRALADPRVRILADDPRRVLSRSRETWDLVLLLGPDPVTLSRSRLLTAEAFRDVASRLAPDGALVVSLRTASAALTGTTAALGGSVYGALRAAFPVVRVTPGPDSLLVAGFDAAAVTLDPSVVAARFRERRIESSSFAAELFPLFLDPGNVARIEAALADASRRVPPSRDDRPGSLLHALARRQRETASLPGRGLGALGRLPPPLLVALVLLPSAALVARGLAAPPSLRLAALHAAAATGAAGMAVSFLLLLSYQTREGALYGALGALTAGFMLGLAAGAAAARAFTAARRPAPCPALRVVLLLAATVFAGIAALLPALAGLSKGPPTLALAAHAALLLAAGAATGALFPVVSLALLGSGQDAGTAAASFEAADHLGAAFAALLAGVVLVPALGMTATGFLATALVLLAAAGTARVR